MSKTKYIKNILINNNYCNCIIEDKNNLNQSYNNIRVSNNMRISQLLVNNLNGRIQYINNNNLINFLGGIEGRINGYGQVLRNKF